MASPGQWAVCPPPQMPQKLEANSPDGPRFCGPETVDVQGPGHYGRCSRWSRCGGGRPLWRTGQGRLAKGAGGAAGGVRDQAFAVAPLPSPGGRPPEGGPRGEGEGPLAHTHAVRYGATAIGRRPPPPGGAHAPAPHDPHTPPPTSRRVRPLPPTLHRPPGPPGGGPLSRGVTLIDKCRRRGGGRDQRRCTRGYGPAAPKRTAPRPSPTAPQPINRRPWLARPTWP